MDLRLASRGRASRGRKPAEWGAWRIRGLTPPARLGFTLVELLVSIAIIVLLAGLTVAFLPAIQEQQRSADAGVQVQRALLVAQQRARRDQASRGVRFLVGANGQVTSYQYLELPDDFTLPGSYLTPSTMTWKGGSLAPGWANGGTAGTYISFVSPPPPPSPPPVLDFFQGLGPALGAPAMDLSLAAVQPGDYLEVSGAVHQIANLWPTPGVYPQVCSTLELVSTFITTGATALTQGTLAANNYEITLSNPNAKYANLGNICVGCYLDLDFSTPIAETVQVAKISASTSTPGFVNVTVSSAASGTIYTHPIQIPLGGFLVQSHGIASFGPGTTYRIIRAQRVSADELLQLPNNVAIDLTTNGLYGNALPIPSPQQGSTLDIMFAPSGAVTVWGTLSGVRTQGIPQDFLALWVRDTNAGPVANGTVEFELSPTIIAVYPRTGLVAAHPPALPPATPYQYVVSGSPQ